MTVPPAERSDLRWLAISALVEALSLVVLLANLVTVHVPQVASVLGPVHGFAYLATIATAFLLPLNTRTRLLTLVPAIGGLLALRRARRPPSVAPTRDLLDSDRVDPASRPVLDDRTRSVHGDDESD